MDEAMAVADGGKSSDVEVGLGAEAFGLFEQVEACGAEMHGCSFEKQGVKGQWTVVREKNRETEKRRSRETEKQRNGEAEKRRSRETVQQRGNENAAWVGGIGWFSRINS